jgi:elongation factor G
VETEREAFVKEFPAEKIRNIALVGHGTSGKTILADALLVNMKSISRIGSVDAGTATMDYSQGEHKRKISLQLATGYGEWRENKINILDTPGYDDFIGETVAALRVADAALVVVNAVAGVEAGTERAFDIARERGMPTMLCVNMMDKENADFDRTVARAREVLSEKVVPLAIPIGQGPDFKGLVDLFKMKAFIYTDATAKEEEIPDENRPAAETAREALIEAVAEFDDAVIEKYLEGESLSQDEILSALRKGVTKGGVYPVLVTSGQQNRGVRRLLDACVVCFPAPTDLPPVAAKKEDEDITVAPDPEGPPSALVFKTVIEPHLGELSLLRVYSGTLESGSEVYNVTRSTAEKMGQLYLLQGKERTDAARLVAGDIGAAVKLKDTHTGDTLARKNVPIALPPIVFPTPVSAEAIQPIKKGDEDKMGMGLHKIMEEDPTVILEIDPELHQHVLRAMGELHLEVVLDKLRERHVEVELKKPKIHFRETITRKSEGQGRYKKQTGGRGQYGDVWLRLEPRARSEGFEFQNKVVGGVVPGKFIPAVEKGVREAMTRGIVAGYPVVDISVTIYDGSHHSVDSSEMAFKVAGSMAFKKVMEEAGPVLLEPIVELAVSVPEDFTGDVMGDLSSRRGKILGIEPGEKLQTIRALVPQAEMYHYGAHLRSFTQGRGRFGMKFHAHEEVPRELADKIAAEARAAREEGEGN